MTDNIAYAGATIMTDIDEIEAAFNGARFETDNSEWACQYGASLIATIRTLTEERDKLRKALEQIACFDDVKASSILNSTGDCSTFDEPGSVCIARDALAQLP